MKRRWCIAVLLIASAGCSPSHRVVVSQPPVITGETLPIEFHFDLPVITALVNGTPARLIVDVGGHDTVTLTREAIGRLGVERRAGHRAMSFDAAGKISVDAGIFLNTLQLGRVVLSDVEGHEIDFGGPAEFEQGVDGYVGAAVLRKFSVLVEYPSSIALFPAAAEVPDSIGGRWVAVPIDERINSRGTLNGRAVRAAWDTGAGRCVIDERFARKTFGEEPSRISGTLMLGEARFDDIDLTVVDLSGARVDIILGHNVFASHRVWFAFDKNVAFVEFVN